MRRRNADETLRDLERRIRGGDRDALASWVEAEAALLPAPCGPERDALARRVAAALLASGTTPRESLEATWSAFSGVDPALLCVEDPLRVGGDFHVWGEGPQPEYLRRASPTWFDESGGSPPPIPEHAYAWLMGNLRDRWCVDAYATEARLRAEPAVRGFKLKAGEYESSMARAYDELAKLVLPERHVVIYSYPDPEPPAWQFRYVPFISEPWAMFGPGGLKLGIPKPERRALELKAMRALAETHGRTVEAVEATPPHVASALRNAGPDERRRDLERRFEAGDVDAGRELLDVLDETGDDVRLFDRFVHDLVDQARREALRLDRLPASDEVLHERVVALESAVLEQVRNALDAEDGVAWTVDTRRRESDVYVVVVRFSKSRLVVGVSPGRHFAEPDPGAAWRGLAGFGPDWAWSDWARFGVRVAKRGAPGLTEPWERKVATDVETARLWARLAEAGVLGPRPLDGGDL